MHSEFDPLFPLLSVSEGDVTSTTRTVIGSKTHSSTARDSRRGWSKEISREMKIKLASALNIVTHKTRAKKLESSE
jgi:hypothetical protein